LSCTACGKFTKVISPRLNEDCRRAGLCRAPAKRQGQKQQESPGSISRGFFFP
jgi:hypothetical protein